MLKFIVICPSFWSNMHRRHSHFSVHILKQQFFGLTEPFFNSINITVAVLWNNESYIVTKILINCLLTEGANSYCLHNSLIRRLSSNQLFFNQESVVGLSEVICRSADLSTLPLCLLWNNFLWPSVYGVLLLT